MKKFNIVFILVITVITSVLITQSCYALTNSEIDGYNHVAYPQSVYNDGINKAPQATNQNFSISPSSGNANVRVTDISLEGRNGFNLNLTRVYNSSQSNLLEPYIKQSGSTTHTEVYYKVMGKKDFEKIDTYNNLVDFGYNQTICINKNYVVSDTSIQKYQKMSTFEYANSNNPAISNLFANYSEAQALVNALNSNPNDILAIYPSGGVGEYWANYKDFSVYTVSVQVSTPSYTTALLEDTAMERYSKIGAGWEFDFPYVEKRYGNDWFEYLHYGDKGVYEIDLSKPNGLKGYPLNDIKVANDTSVQHDGKWSQYSVTEKNGIKSFYANDGRLLLMRDRFSNEIKFYHDTEVYKDTLGTNHQYPYLIKIVDSVGREIIFNYGSNYTLGANTYSNITISINDSTNAQNNRQIIYRKLKVTKSQTGNTQYENFLLDRVEKPNGDYSKYDYRISEGRVNFQNRNTSFYYTYIGSKKPNAGNSYVTSANYTFISGESNFYALLERAIEENGREYQLDYSRFLKNCTETGSMMFYKAIYVCDDARRDSEDYELFANVRRHTYFVDGDIEYDGYPTHKRSDQIGTSFRVKSKVAMQNLPNNQTNESTYSFRYVGWGADQAILLDNVSTIGTVNKSTVNYQYESGTNLQTQVLTRNYASLSSNVYMQLQEDYTYDTGKYGDLKSYKPNNVADRAYTCEYEPTYHYLTEKVYKSDSNTTYKEKYIPTTSNQKSVEWFELYENNNLKKKVKYSHDTYGNIINQKEYLDNGTDFVETVNSYTDNVTARNGKFNGLYLTSQTIKDVEDADGNLSDISLSFTYSWFGNLLEKTDNKGNPYSFEYDKINRVIKEINPDNSFRTYGYSYGYYTIAVLMTDELGNEFTNIYDSSDNLIKEYSGYYGTLLKEYFYNAHNLPVKVIEYSDYNNKTTTLSDYDSLLRPTYKEIRDNSNNKIYRENYSFNIADSNGQYSKETITIEGDSTTPAIVRSTYKNNFGNIVKNELGSDFEILTYDYLGQQKTVKSARANNENWTESFTNKFDYNYLGKAVNITDVNGDFSTNVYDTLGRVTESYSVLGNKATVPYATIFVNDHLGRIIEQKTPFESDNGTIIYSTKKIYYDNNGNVIKEKQQSNAVGEAESYNITECVYNSRNQLIMTISNDGAETFYTQNYYDVKGNLLRVYTGLTSPLTINGLDNVTATGDSDYAVTKYEYDEFSRLTKMTDPLGKFVQHIYDKKGTLVSTIDKNGNNLSLVYDGLNNLREKSVIVNAAKTDIVTTLYGVNGLVASANNSVSNINYLYNNKGLLVKETDTANNTEKSYTYDSNDNRKSFILKKNNALELTIGYEYDRLNRLWKVFNDTTLEAEYLYDNNGNRIGTITASGNNTEYLYNLAGLPTEQTTGTDLSEEFTYYLNGNQKTKAIGSKITDYSYDNMNRLVAENGTTYTFDDFGNRQTKNDGNSYAEYQYNKNNQLIKEIEENDSIKTNNSYFYDFNGNQISKATTIVKQYEQGVSGEYTAELETNNYVTLYGYNKYNQLISHETDGVLSTYNYNADGLRKSKNVGGTITAFIYDGVNIISEINGANTINYLRGYEIIKNSDNISYIHNRQGDVSILKNASGVIVANYEFDAYGISDEGNNQYPSNNFGYRGEYQDQESGLIYLRNRYYNPKVGIFITEDPIRSGLNWYIYTNGNPILFADPSGLTPSVLEAALMAEHIYNFDTDSSYADRMVKNNGVNTWWRLIDTVIEGDLKIGIYIRTNPIFSDWRDPIEYAVVFKGTTPSSSEDWKNNAQQYLGVYSEHLAAGLAFTSWFVKSKEDYQITFIGHSKGGGEAAVSAEWWNKNAIVFNPSVPNLTLMMKDEGYVQPHVVTGDILNYYLDELPLGETTYLKQQHNGWLPGVSITDRLNNHSMSSVISALRKEGYK